MVVTYVWWSEVSLESQNFQHLSSVNKKYVIGHRQPPLTQGFILLVLLMLLKPSVVVIEVYLEIGSRVSDLND